MTFQGPSGPALHHGALGHRLRLGVHRQECAGERWELQGVGAADAECPWDSGCWDLGRPSLSWARAVDPVGPPFSPRWPSPATHTPDVLGRERCHVRRPTSPPNEAGPVTTKVTAFPKQMPADGRGSPGPGRREERAWRGTAAGDPDGSYSGMSLSFMRKGKEGRIFLRMRTPIRVRENTERRMCPRLRQLRSGTTQGLDTFQRRVL